MRLSARDTFLALAISFGICPLKIAVHYRNLISVIIAAEYLLRISSRLIHLLFYQSSNHSILSAIFLFKGGVCVVEYSRQEIRVTCNEIKEHNFRSFLSSISQNLLKSVIRFILAIGSKSSTFFYVFITVCVEK